MQKYWVAVVATMMLATQTFAQSASQVTLTLEATPSKVKPGVHSTIKARFKNLQRDEQITLTATATYLVGDQQQIVSASTTLVIDRSVDVTLNLNIGPLSVVPNTIKLDDVAVTSNPITITIPGDGQEHILSFDVVR